MPEYKIDRFEHEEPAHEEPAHEKYFMTSGSVVMSSFGGPIMPSTPPVVIPAVVIPAHTVVREEATIGGLRFAREGDSRWVAKNQWEYTLPNGMLVWVEAALDGWGVGDRYDSAYFAMDEAGRESARILAVWILKFLEEQRP